jgi:hypothetical protein
MQYAPRNISFERCQIAFARFCSAGTAPSSHLPYYYQGRGEAHSSFIYDRPVKLDFPAFRMHRARAPTGNILPSVSCTGFPGSEEDHLLAGEAQAS